MATWDNKEREIFKIDSESLKQDIDAIQSEKIEILREEITTTRQDLEKSSTNNINAAFNELEGRIAAIKIISEDALVSQQHQLYGLNREFKTHQRNTLKALRMSAFFISVSIIQGVILWLKLKGN